MRGPDIIIIVIVIIILIMIMIVIIIIMMMIIMIIIMIIMIIIIMGFLNFRKQNTPTDTINQPRIYIIGKSFKTIT